MEYLLYVVIVAGVLLAFITFSWTVAKHAKAKRNQSLAEDQSEISPEAKAMARRAMSQVYPVAASAGEGVVRSYGSRGISLRDHAAITMIAAMVRTTDYDFANEAVFSDKDFHVLAKNGYRLADAIVAEGV